MFSANLFCPLQVFFILPPGSEDIVIVDTTESPETATEVMREFRKITSKPCKAVVITHYHAGSNSPFRGSNTGRKIYNRKM